MKPRNVHGAFLFCALSIVFPAQLHALEPNVEELKKRVAVLERLVNELSQRISKLEGQGPATRGEAKRVDTKTKGNWREKGNWRRLEKGMSMDQVTALLGEPEKVNVGTQLIFWYWDYPRGPSVDFNAETKRVSGWSEP